MAGSTNQRAVGWLRSQLPELIASGAITSVNAAAIERYYESRQTRSNFAFVLLATVGSVLVAAGVILLIAHNWDELSRAARTAIAFLPLLIAQALIVFVLLRRNESRPWREAVAIFDVAAVATAISLVSQTYQLQGTFAEFMRIWLLLSIPIVYLLRTTFGAVLYIIGTVTWLTAQQTFFGRPSSPMFFWLLLLLVLPYFWLRFRNNRESHETTILAVVLSLAAVIGLGFTADFAKASFGAIAFAGLVTAIYLCGMKFFPREGDRLSAVALTGGIGIGVTAIVLSFEPVWHLVRGASSVERSLDQNFAFGLELLFPIAAVCLAMADLIRRSWRFSLMAAALPIIAAIGWGIAHLCSLPNDRYESTQCSVTAATMFICYVLFLGIDIIARGILTHSIARANFGLVLIAALAICRFFDSDMSFIARGIGFILVGAGFLIANIILFRKRAAA